jgi:nucleoside-diphosphate-sugar epimerase
MKVNGYEWAHRKVLVTGASGFKGSWLCATLRRLGAPSVTTCVRQGDPLRLM